MTEKMRAARDRPGWPYFLGAYAMVWLYLNTFEIWRMLQAVTGPVAEFVPYGLAAAVGLGIVVWGRNAERARGTVSWGLVLAGVALAGIGLGVTDPLFPSKRIHVPQYILLALVVRAGLSRELSGWNLTLMGALLATLYGSHDELLQGLHTKRTYGMPDMQVNALGALAGSLMAHGLRLLDRGVAAAAPPPTVIAGFAGALFGFFLFLDALLSFRGAAVPLWLVLPALAGLLCWAVADGLCHARYGYRRAFALGALLIAAALLYPFVPLIVVPHVAPLVFE
ncbi:MAG: VanZ family protein [Alphaproteobacteria bacterium]